MCLNVTTLRWQPFGHSLTTMHAMAKSIDSNGQRAAKSLMVYHFMM